ncbi:MAG: HlyD family efflux transporter periplasmic adaptor subunit [Anaerolineae bacterium]|nr:HlyD family efflux transporter periplasmic adaptor subunit [Anaerolineae bacterium]
MEILVAEGDAVEASQELAKLDTRDLEQALSQAEAGLKSAQAQLAKAKAGARAEELVSADANVSIAQAEARTAEYAIETAEGNLAAAQAAYEQAKAGVESARSAVKIDEGNLASAQAALGTAQANLSQLLAGPTDLEIQIAEKRVEIAQNQLWGYQSQRDAASGAHVSAAEREAAKANVATGETQVIISQLELEQLKAGPQPADVAVARAKVTEAQANVQIAQATLAQAQAQVASAEAQAKEAQARVETTGAQVSQSKSQHEAALARVTRAEAEGDLLKAGQRPEEIAIAEAAVAQAEASLMEARNALDDAVLRAPFAGTVGEILAQEGELIGAQVTVIRVGDLTCLRAETSDLSEVDITRVVVGQGATVTADALQGQSFDGTVSQVALTASDYRGDKVYTTVVDLETSPDVGLRWGMTAFVRIKVR